MKIRLVRLESDVFLIDMDFVQSSSAERGVYYSLILLLTCNDGKCRFDPSALSRMCSAESPEDSERIWERISEKFQTRDDVIRHKRVT
jgi:hypothetical protein